MDQPYPTAILPALENLAFQYGITNIYKTCDTLEGLEESLSLLLYEDRNFKDYGILYLVFEGDGNQITLDGYYYTLEEIAEFFVLADMQEPIARNPPAINQLPR